MWVPYGIEIMASLPHIRILREIGVLGGKTPRDLAVGTQLQRAISPGAFLPITPAPVSDVFCNSGLLDVIHNGLVALRIAEEPITQFNTPLAFHIFIF